MNLIYSKEKIAKMEIGLKVTWLNLKRKVFRMYSK